MVTRTILVLYRVELYIEDIIKYGLTTQHPRSRCEVRRGRHQGLGPVQVQGRLAPLPGHFKGRCLLKVLIFVGSGSLVYLPSQASEYSCGLPSESHEQEEVCTVSNSGQAVESAMLA